MSTRPSENRKSAGCGYTPIGARGNLDLAADSAVIHCEDVFPILTSLPALKETREDIASIRGTVTVDNPSLRGPIRDPGRWRLTAVSELRDIVITSTFLNEPMEVPVGRLTAGEVDSRALPPRCRMPPGCKSGTDKGSWQEMCAFPHDTRLDLGTAEALDWNEIERSRHIARHPGEGRPVRGRVGVRVEHRRSSASACIPFMRYFPRKARGSISSGPVLRHVHRPDGLCRPTVDAYLVPVVDVMSLDSVVSC
jgi:hypothetical protein